MKKITDILKKSEVLVFDGAWGTMLQKMGLKAGECPELWNTIYPERVIEIGKAYVNAGADLIETNSFGGNRLKLASWSLQDKAAELNRQAAMLSRQAAGNSVLVIGSIGPTGKMLMMGDITEAELYDAFAEQASALAEGGADALIIETMSATDEACIAVQAAKEATNLEVICTMTFNKADNGEYHTMMGVKPEQMVDELLAAGADAIGANCSNGIKEMIALTAEIRSYNRQIPIIIQANAGLPVYSNGQTLYKETPADMASPVNELIKAGASVIGGCCGTTPDHIAAIKQACNAYRRTNH